MSDIPIGLQRYTVKLSPYNEKWLLIFNALKENLEKILDQKLLDIQHIGSTSVPGLDAKPIIDIALLISGDSLIKEIIPLLEAEGYEYRGDAGDNGGQLFVFNLRPEFRTQHLHFISEGDPQWHNYLLFRDALKHDKHLKNAYRALKKDLEEKYTFDRENYTEGKGAFILETLATIKHGSS